MILNILGVEVAIAGTIPGDAFLECIYSSLCITLVECYGRKSI